jgi:DNA-directed RNA polymerase subunit B
VANEENRRISQKDLYYLARSFIEEKGLSRQHLESFNRFAEKTIYEIVESRKTVHPGPARPYYYGRKQPMETQFPMFSTKVKIGKLRIGKPMVKEVDGAKRSVTPTECRLRNLTYSVPLYLEMTLVENGIEREPEEIHIGDLPIMVRSVLDPLSNKSDEELA